MLYEELLTHISKSGPIYRWIITILIGFMSVKAAFDIFVLNLTTAYVPYHCAQALITNETLPLSSILANYTIVNNFSAFDFTCSRPRFQRVQGDELRLINNSGDIALNQSDKLNKCSAWTFSPDRAGRYSMFIEYEIVCDNKYLMDRIQTVYQLGIFLSAALGPLGDVIGRKRCMIIFGYLDLACNIAIIFVRDLSVHMVLRFFMGFGAQGLFIGLMIITEIVGEEYRSIHGNLIWILWVLAYCGSAAIGYLVYNWRMQMVVVVVIIGAVYAIYIPLIPESPRWLLTRGKTKQAKRVMKEICKFSGCKEVLENFNFENNELVDELLVEEKESCLFRIIPRENLCRMKYLVAIAVITFIFYTVDLVYFALSFQRDFIIEDAYLNIFVSGALELPAYIAAWQMASRMGHKFTTISTMGICGVGLIVLPFIPADAGAALVTKIVFASVVKFCITIANSVLNVYAYEVLPTNVRSCSFFFASFITGSGLVLAPELGGILESIYENLALFLFGGLSVLASLLTVLLPETKSKAMPNSVSEMQLMTSPCHHPKSGVTVADQQHLEKAGPDCDREELKALNVSAAVAEV